LFQKEKRAENKNPKEPAGKCREGSHGNKNLARKKKARD